LFLDLTFLAANLLKVVDGGWVPLALGGIVMLLMYTWRRGSRLLFREIAQTGIPARRSGGDAGKAAAAAGLRHRGVPDSDPKARRPR